MSPINQHNEFSHETQTPERNEKAYSATAAQKKRKITHLPKRGHRGRALPVVFASHSGAVGSHLDIFS